MLQVGVCIKQDDLIPVIEDYLKARNCWYDLQTFPTIEELFYFFEKETMDLLFIDVDSEEHAEAARRLSELYRLTKVVAVVPEEYREKEGVRDFFYIVAADNLKTEMPVLMDRFFIRERYLKHPRMLVSGKSGQVVLEIKDLMYVERDKRNSTLVCCQGENVSTPHDLAALQELMARDDFVRCHNSYLVNLNYVKELRRNEFILKNGMEIPISRRYLDEVRRRLKLWVESVW